MSVGANRLFFRSVPLSSLSLSLASLLVPDTLVAVLRGVSGGVVIGTPVTLPELAAVMPGTLPAMRVALEIMGGADDCVATEEVEFDLVGDDGRPWTNEAVGGGEGAVNELAEFRWWCCGPFGKGEGGANTDVGVGAGVLWLDEAAAVPGTTGCLYVGTSPA